MLTDVILEDTTIEESVVLPEATIRDREICRLIVDQQTDIESLNIADTVIGAHTN